MQLPSFRRTGLQSLRSSCPLASYIAPTGWHNVLHKKKQKEEANILDQLGEAWMMGWSICLHHKQRDFSCHLFSSAHTHPAVWTLHCIAACNNQHNIPIMLMGELPKLLYPLHRHLLKIDLHALLLHGAVLEAWKTWLACFAIKASTLTILFFNSVD